jgi:trehalose-6-phosphate synthase
MSAGVWPLVVVSHRGPGGDGGVAAGLDPLLRRTRGCWVASDGARRPYPVVRVPLSAAELDGYYRGYANEGLWPLCHGLVERALFRTGDWEVYRAVNERFARAAAQVAAPGGAVWVHDYQLALVPAMLRALRPDVRIGFFWHIPWPAEPIWRLCPQADAIVAGIAAADLVGLHTPDYAAAFRALVPPVVQVRALPMGVDFAGIAALAGQAATERRMRRLALALGLPGQRLILGVDRCDYTKGIPHRLAAVEAFFRRWPEYRGRVSVVQVASPTRVGMPAYDRLRRLVRRQVAALNRELGDGDWRPVHLIGRRLRLPQLVALYRLADVALVTPLYDGMNLVAKEFVAARVDGDGVLVLSRTAGAAVQLREALAVNPLDPDGIAATLHQALAMAPAERQRRMAALRAEVERHDVQAWLAANLAAIGVQLPAARRGRARAASLTR